MSRYKFEIIVNGMLLKTVHNPKEELGLRHCKRFVKEFQTKVANLEVKIKIWGREQQKFPHQYKNQPYTTVRTLRKPPISTNKEQSNKDPSGDDSRA